MKSRDERGRRALRRLKISEPLDFRLLSYSRFIESPVWP